MVKSMANKTLSSKKILNGPKDGLIQKKKSEKFKRSLTGKVALINGSQIQNSNNIKIKKLQKRKSNSSQNSPENKGLKKKDYQKSDKKQQESSKKQLNKNSVNTEKDELDSEDDDINEGIVLQEQSMMEDSENNESELSDSDESEEEKNLPNILGNSLADESDEDDEDYEEEEEEEEEGKGEEIKKKAVQVKKGIKMFDGLKANDSSKDNSDKSGIEDTVTDDSDDEIEEAEVEGEDEDDDDADKDDEGEDDEDEDEDEDDESEEEEEVTGFSSSLGALLGNSIAEDDEDDEDFVEPQENDEAEDEDEDDDDDEDEDEDEDEDDDDDDDDDNDEDDEDEESEDEDELTESSLGLKALLGNSIAEDDDDDEDFVEPHENDEDDDISDEDEEEEEEESEEENNTLENFQIKKNNKKNKDDSLQELKEDKRTIFVGNLKKDVTKKQLQKLFKQFGKIDAIRLRGKIAKSMHSSKRLAAIKNDLHPKLKSVYAYIRFVSEESVHKALSLNGTVFEGNYIRVDTTEKTEKKFDTKKSVFLGNLHFNIDDNAIRKHFEQCGEIDSIRVIRDNQTGVGKGFGYINFKDNDSVALALELDGTAILNREIRVKPGIDQDKSKKNKYGKRSHSVESTSNVSHKKIKHNTEMAVSARNKANAVKRLSGKEQKSETKQTSPQQGNKFQGQKADSNKKKRKNKLDKKKKLLSEKLTAKPKKPTN